MNTPITYQSSVFARQDADYLLKSLWNELDWVRHEKVPRREYYCNDFNKPYTYGTPPFSRTYDPQPLHASIVLIRNVVEKMANCRFEVCFLNGYENQSDQLGWHSDNSPEMDDERPIAIVSFGVEREIWFRPVPTGLRQDGFGLATDKLKLEHGSVCLMHAGMQDTHQHRIPKASFMCGERVSLTFRGYVNTNEGRNADTTT